MKRGFYLFSAATIFMPCRKMMDSSTQHMHSVRAKPGNKAVEQTCAGILEGGLFVCACVWTGGIRATISSSVTREGGGG